MTDESSSKSLCPLFMEWHISYLSVGQLASYGRDHVAPPFLLT